LVVCLGVARWRVNAVYRRVNGVAAHAKNSALKNGRQDRRTTAATRIIKNSFNL